MDNIFSNAVIYMFHVSTILLIVLLINSEAEIPTGYFGVRNYAWKEARNSCKLIGLFGKIQVSENNGTLGWIDASVEYTPWVEYKKCYRVKQEYIQKNKRVKYGNQLQECLQFCKAYNYIGLQQANCSCLSLNKTDSTTVESECTAGTTETCKKDEFLFCANGKTSLDNFYIYKTGNINEQFKAGNCLRVFSSSGLQKYFQAEQCQNILFSLCTQDSGTQTTPAVPGNWTKSVELCSDHHLISYNAYKNLEIIHRGSFWLANIRRPIIRNVVDSNQTYCVAVRIRERDHIVFPIVRLCTEKLPALCKDNDITSSYETSSTITVEAPPGFKQKENSINDILLIALIIAAVLTVVVIIAVIVLYKRRTSLRSGHRPLVVPSNEVTYAQVNKPTKEKTPEHAGDSIRNNTADDTYDHMEHHRPSQNQNSTESNYDTMQSVGIEELENDYDVTNGTDRQKQIVLDDTAEYSHVEVVNQEIKDVST